MINRVVLVGRLTKDPELRYTPNGVPVSTFTLAVNRTFTNRQGEREADFINCSLAETGKNVLTTFVKEAWPVLKDGFKREVTKPRMVDGFF